MGGVTPADVVLLSPMETTAATVRSPSVSTAQRAYCVYAAVMSPTNGASRAELRGDGGEVLLRPLAVVLVVHVHVEDLARAAVPAAGDRRAEHREVLAARDADRARPDAHGDAGQGLQQFVVHASSFVLRGRGARHPSARRRAATKRE